MSTPNTHNSPLASSPIPMEEVETYGNAEACCGAQWIPVSQQGFYLKFVLIVCSVFGGISFVVYLLLEYLTK